MCVCYLLPLWSSPFHFQGLPSYSRSTSNEEKAKSDHKEMDVGNKKKEGRGGEEEEEEEEEDEEEEEEEDEEDEEEEDEKASSPLFMKPDVQVHDTFRNLRNFFSILKW